MKRTKIAPIVSQIAPLAAVFGLGFAALANLSPAQAQNRVVDTGRPPDTGFSLYFAQCAGCHDSAALSADKTVPVMRELGEPRVRRALEDTPTAIHGDLGKRMTNERRELIVGFLSPDNDKSYDCGPPERRVNTGSPQCLELRAAEASAAAAAPAPAP